MKINGKKKFFYSYLINNCIGIINVKVYYNYYWIITGFTQDF